MRTQSMAFINWEKNMKDSTAQMRLLITICTMSNRYMNIVLEREIVSLSCILTLTKENSIYQTNLKIETLPIKKQLESYNELITATHTIQRLDVVIDI